MNGKVLKRSTHDRAVALSGMTQAARVSHSLHDDFDEIYRQWFHRVERWILALGAPSAELEDWTQEVFVIVRRKLAEFDGKNLSGWLYRITTRTASDFRRRAWFRRLFFQAGPVELDGLTDPQAGPAAVLESKEERRTLLEVLGRMEESRRMVLVLSDIEGMSGEEIAATTGCKLPTVWTRLHRARKEFVALVAQLEAR